MNALALKIPDVWVPHRFTRFISIQVYYTPIYDD